MSPLGRNPQERRPISVGDRVKRLGRGDGAKHGTVLALIAPQGPFDTAAQAKVRWDGRQAVRIWPVNFLAVVDDEAEDA